MRKKSGSLGVVDPVTWPDYRQALQEATEQLEKIALSEFTLEPGADPMWNAYKLMNSLGFKYGAGLARAMLSGLNPEDRNFPSEVSRVLEDLLGAYNDAEAMRSLRNDAMIRQAYEAFSDQLPDWIDRERAIELALQSYSGKAVYFNDFYFSVMQSLNDVARALSLFESHHRRPELVSFVKEHAGGDFVPTELLNLSEEEERTLLRRILSDSNKAIARLTWYGPRNEPLPPRGDFTILFWMNGPALWRVDNITSRAVLARDQGLRSVPLDANQALVPYHHRFVSRVVPVLDPLPLYSLSLEAKERNEYQLPTDDALIRAIRSSIEEDQPAEDAEERTVRTIEWFEIFQRAKAGNVVARARADLFPFHPAFKRLVDQWFRMR